MSRVKTCAPILGHVDIRTGYHRIQTWLRHFFEEEAPLATVCCEFDCRKVQCLNDDWETCKNRKKYIASVQEMSR
jgi:hypothetical protein